MRRRVERLGYSREEVSRLFEVAQKRKPTRENLNAIRANIELRASLAPLPWELPQTKKIIRAYVDLQKTKLQRIYLISSGIIKFWKFSEKRALALRLKRIAERDLFYAKERRIAQVGRALRPVLWIARVAMPREVRRLEMAIYRCARLAQRQAIYREEKQAITTAYQNWREQFIKKPLDELKRQSGALSLPTQEEGRGRLAEVIQQINPTDAEITNAVALLSDNYISPSATTTSPHFQAIR
jgi:hypothetical protein